MSMEHRKGIEGVGTVNIIVAVAIFLAPFLTGDGGNVMVSNVISAILIAAIAGFNVYVASQSHTERAYAPGMLNVLLGLWVLASGWLFAGVTTALITTNAVLGGLLAVLAAYNTWAAYDARGRATPARV